MGDIVKEFNMIDFLGMLFPGSLLMLLFGEEFGLWYMLKDFFGDENCIGTITVVVIIGGYAIGMLLHEIGDLLEKILWINPLVNPRSYAAISTRLYVQYEKYENRGEEIKRFKDKKNRVIAKIPAILGPSFIIWLMHLAFPKYNLLLISLGIVAIVSSIIIPYIVRLLIKTVGIEMTGSAHEDAPECILQAICNDDSFLMYTAANNGTSKSNVKSNISRKLNLFDGFRTMARNIFVAFCILQIYSNHSNGIISSLIDNIHNSQTYLHLLYLILLVLLLRYWHFSYLKYKYCYEELVYAAKKDTNSDPPKPTQCPCCAAVASISDK